MSCWTDTQEIRMAHCTGCYNSQYEYTVCLCSCHNVSFTQPSTMVGMVTACGCGEVAGCPGVSVCKCSCHTLKSSNRTLEEPLVKISETLESIKDALKAIERSLRSGR